MLDHNLEVSKKAMEIDGETAARQRDPPMHRPQGRLVFSVFREQKVGQLLGAEQNQRG